jgi:hypothetical protein
MKTLIFLYLSSLILNLISILNKRYFKYNNDKFIDLLTLLNAKISICDEKKYNNIKLIGLKLNKFDFRTDKLVIGN